MKETEKTTAEKIEDVTGKPKPKMTNAKFTVPTTKESAALRIIINALFEFGDILFEPDGPNGPSLVVNNESGTEISLTEFQSEMLKAVGIPTFKEDSEAPSFDDLLSTTTGDARALMGKIRDAREEDAFMETLRQLTPLKGSRRTKEVLDAGCRIALRADMERLSKILHEAKDKIGPEKDKADPFTSSLWYVDFCLDMALEYADEMHNFIEPAEKNE